MRLALPKGELFEPSLAVLERAGFDIRALKEESRRMVFPPRRESDGLEYIVCRPSDVPVYVEYGAADLGIAGKDVLMEAGKNLFELADLGFGHCRFVLAAPEGDSRAAENYRHLGHLRVATKYPKVTEEYFSRRGVQVEVIRLKGNVELAPLVGLAEAIVDLASTGRTLRENNLQILEVIAECTARLISNIASQKLRFEEMNRLVRELREAAEICRNPSCPIRRQA